MPTGEGRHRITENNENGSIRNRRAENVILVDFPLGFGKTVYFEVIISCHGEWNPNGAAYCQTAGASLQWKS